MDYETIAQAITSQHDWPTASEAQPSTMKPLITMVDLLNNLNTFNVDNNFI